MLNDQLTILFFWFKKLLLAEFLVGLVAGYVVFKNQHEADLFGTLPVYYRCHYYIIYVWYILEFSRDTRLQ